MRQQAFKFLPKQAWIKTILWVFVGVALVMGLAALEKYYNLPGTWITLARAMVVIFIGLRVIGVIDNALSSKRATVLTQLVMNTGDTARTLSWQESVTGMYITRLLLYAGLVLITVFAVGGTLSGFVVGGTLVSVMLGVAGQSFFANFFGGLAIALFKPFELGDHIQLIAGSLPILPETYSHGLRPQGYQGFIRDINLFYTELRLDDGQLLRVPNGVVISSGIIERTPHGWIRISFRFDVDASLDSEMLLDTLAETAQKAFCPEDIADAQHCDADFIKEPDPQRINQATPAGAAQQLQKEAADKTTPRAPGWQMPEVAIVDLSPSTTSIEVRASVPYRQQAYRREYFLRSIMPHIRPSKKQA